MDSKLVYAALVGAAIMLSATLLAGESGSRYAGLQPFKIVFLKDIGSDGVRARIRERATKARVSAVQAEIAADRVLLTKLRARGIQVRNIIGREEALNGRMIYYVR